MHRFHQVTYMLTFITAFGGYVYFNFTKNDYTYEGLRWRMVSKRLNKYLKKEGMHNITKYGQQTLTLPIGLDPARNAEVKSQIAHIQQLLKTPELALLKGL